MRILVGIADDAEDAGPISSDLPRDITVEIFRGDELILESCAGAVRPSARRNPKAAACVAIGFTIRSLALGSGHECSRPRLKARTF